MNLDTLLGRNRHTSAPPSSLEEIQKDPRRLRTLLEGSSMRPHKTETAWKEWEQGRRPVANIIDELLKGTEGTVSMLDYGCANGLLLFSLQRWSAHQIEPYGYDTDKKRIRTARELFPDQTNQFAENGQFDSLPPSYDLAFWNLWDNWHFKGPEAQKRLGLFRKLLSRSRYLVVGLYDTNPEERKRKLGELASFGHIALGTRDSKTGKETFAWFKGTGGPPMAVDNSR